MKNRDSCGTLVLAINRGDEINVEYSKEKIINKINSYFGYKLIDEIKLQVINSRSIKKKNDNALKSSSKKFEKKINEIKNKNLKNYLGELLTVLKND